MINRHPQAVYMQEADRSGVMVACDTHRRSQLRVWLEPRSARLHVLRAALERAACQGRKPARLAETTASIRVCVPSLRIAPRR
jgi:hypothetical protein